MTPDGVVRRVLPDPVLQTLDDFKNAFSLDLQVWMLEDDGTRTLVYPLGQIAEADPDPNRIRRLITPSEGPAFEVELSLPSDQPFEATANLLQLSIERTFEFASEIGFFTYELSERFEEINLLYSISETLGSLLGLEEAAHLILEEVCEVLSARRGSLWVYEEETDLLQLIASVGEEGMAGPLSASGSDTITAQVFREGRPQVGSNDPREPDTGEVPKTGTPHSVISVPVRYTPPKGESRTVGVMNLVGRRRGGAFAASDQKLLAAIASQVGSALENHRLIQESLVQERVTREMELAHHLQMKLLPVVESFEGAEVAARVQPDLSVGGDFYHLFRLSKGRIGVMIGDVSTHGFPAALMMALSMSAAAIYAMESTHPGQVLRALDDALLDELETTEMFITLFYGVLNPKKGELIYSNAGHPHAFAIREDGSAERLAATDPPVGFAGRDSYGEERVKWKVGSDLLLLFTDGLSDILASEDRSSGEEMVLETAVRGRHQTPQEIVNQLFSLVAGSTPAIQGDDRTAMIVRI